MDLLRNKVMMLGLLVATTWGCSNAPVDAKQKIGSGQNAVKTEPPKLMSRARYEVRVYSLRNLSTCRENDIECGQLASGEIMMETMSNFSIKFVSGSVRMLNNPDLTLDLTKSLSQFAPEAGQDTMAGNLSSDADGRIVMTKRVGDILFEPARPLILGPIIQNPDDFRGLEKTYSNIRFSTAPNSKAPPASGTATIHLKVVNPRERYTPRSQQVSASPFEVMHWEMALDNSSGTSTQNVQGLLLNKISFYWRTRPIQIPRLVLETDLPSLMGGKADPMMGFLTVRVTLDALEITTF